MEKKAAAGHVVRQTEPRPQHKGTHYRRKWQGGEDRWGRERRQRDHLLRNIAAGSGSEKAEERGREEKTEEGRGSLWERSRHVSDGG